MLHKANFSALDGVTLNESSAVSSRHIITLDSNAHNEKVRCVTVPDQKYVADPGFSREGDAPHIHHLFQGGVSISFM